MSTLRSRKYLSCFYCGRRSKFRFEGQKSFDCTNCDATNWLDDYGEITDPPSSPSVIERSRVQYAIPRPSAPPRSLSPDAAGSEESIFCDTCLRNQHMLTSSLAQFEWPEDQRSAEYVLREKKYYALRKDLEKRYPQMCADCEPRVEKKLHEASYTAQTDHLRRMMDRTRSQRQEVKQRGFLDVVDTFGKWSWHLGFALQFLWHIAMVWSLIVDPYILGEAGANSRVATALKGIHQLSYGRLPRLPQADSYMRWAINLGLYSLPWNPRFKQTIRGFTAHYLGFKHWYTYQLFILLVRYAGISMAQYSSLKGSQISAQLGAQLAIALSMTYVYHASRRSIHTDTSPLFRQYSKANSPRTPTARSEAKPEPLREQNDLGSALDEIAQSPPRPHNGSTQRFVRSSNNYGTTTSNGMFGGVHERSHRNQSSEPTFGSLHLSDPIIVDKPEPQVVQYDEEMDWTPSASQHRAFSEYNPYRVKNTNPRFNDAPIEPKSGPIWYKVPPAPTNPAQRMRNPPMRPIIRESPKEKKENFFKSTRGPVDMGSSKQNSLSDIKFSDPKFFAPEDKDDPRDGLSKMFASSFSISPSPDDAAVRSSRLKATGSFFKAGPNASDAPNRRTTRCVELVVLVGALYGWILALGTQEQYGLSLALTSVIAGLIVSIRLAADLQVDAQIRDGKQPSIFEPSWANLGLVQVLASLILAWSIWSGSGNNIPCRTYGSAHFTIAIIHHMWHTFV
ncbi:Ima1 N-terminal domain-containing protein [Annulohypoxylon maeteangense]|uniref:Ima1 N-terminal domain-containing protein n=1 Tax=Annulohypoxylon maeteangense TaxID=1927788 RepID=UPI0020077771|nr:Ima1 N-terminal domain-containing protein [Annulohypoxylon maeteangense]KAI0884622.1 Ima1 N-terminal domain-containing protein [Annulohypoxylon maeteangense]